MTKTTDTVERKISIPLNVAIDAVGALSIAVERIPEVRDTLLALSDQISGQVYSETKTTKISVVATEKPVLSEDELKKKKAAERMRRKRAKEKAAKKLLTESNAANQAVAA